MPLSRLHASLRAAAVVPKGDYAYVIHPLLDGVPRCDAALLDEWAAWAALQPVVKQANTLLAPEAMGLPLVGALALKTGLPYTLARKRAYGRPGEVAVPAATGYGASTLHLNDLGPGDRVLIVDDVLSTGGTLGALLDAIGKTGARAVGAVVVVDKGLARAKLEARHKIAVLAAATIRVTPAGVQVVA